MTRISRSLSREYHALVHSVHREYIPIYSFLHFCFLLMFIALKPVSNTVLHRLTSLAPHYAFPNLQSTCTLPSKLAHRNATHWLAVTRLTISCCSLPLYAAYCISRVLSSFPVNAGYPFLAVPLTSRVATQLGDVAFRYTTHTQKKNCLGILTDYKKHLADSR
jgi:hypothetical protein